MQTYKNTFRVCGLCCLSVVISITCNVLATKLIPINIGLLNGVEVSASSLLFIAIFAISSYAVNTYGKAVSQFISIMTFVCTALFVILANIFRFVPSSDTNLQIAYNELYRNNFSFIVASVVAYVVSIRVSRKLSAIIPKDVATVTAASTLVDAFIYSFIGYYLGCNWFEQPGGFNRWATLFLSQYCIQLVLLTLSTCVSILFGKCIGRIVSKNTAR